MSISSDVISSKYALGEIYSLNRTSEVGGMLISCSRGCFVIRSLKYSSQTKRIFYDQAFTAYLVQRGFPARQFLRTREGHLIWNFENENYYLTEYFEGAFKPDSSKQLTEAQLVEAGVRLATLHLLAKEFPGPKRQKLPYVSEKSYNTLERVKNTIIGKPATDELDELALQVVRKKQENIVRYPFEKQDFMRCQRLTNHGDYHAGNLVFDVNNRIIAVLDFEYCTDMPRIWDIAWAISWLCSEKPTEAFSGRFEPLLIKPFLSSYNGQFSLSLDEQNELCKLCISASYHEVFFLEQYYLNQKDPNNLEKFDNLDEWFWWEQHQDILMTAILESCSQT